MRIDSRRQFLKGAGSAAALGFAGCMGQSGSGGSGTAHKIVLPAGTAYYCWGESALKQGFFADEGIDMTIEYKPFPAYIQSLTSGDVKAGLYSIMPYVGNYNKGEDLVTFGMAGGLQGINGMYTLASNDINAIEDMKGQTVGVWSWGSSTVQSFQGLVAEQTGLNLRKDFETTTAAPPALKGLLDKGEIQAAIEVSSLTVAMQARPDTYRRLGQLNDMWLEQTGFPLLLVSWFTYRDWYENNTDLAKSLVTASQKATDYWRNNTVSILEEFGEPAGIDDKIEIDVVDKWTNQGQVFSGKASSGYVDATWKYLELMVEHGFLDKVPKKSEIIKAPL